MASADDSSSPYLGLVNLCYQLRHEKEELSTAYFAKNELLHDLETRVKTLEKQHSSQLSEKSSRIELLLTEKVELEEKCAKLNFEFSKLSDRYRKLESKEIQSRERADQLEDMVRILKQQVSNKTSVLPSAQSLVEKDIRIRNLENANKKLLRQLETAKILNEKTSQSIGESTSPRKRARQEPVAPTYTLSSSDSLLREYETIMGWSILKENDSGKIDLICNSNEELVIRLSKSVDSENEFQVLSEEEDPSSPAITFLKTFNSIPGYMAKRILEELSKRVYREEFHH